jgi:hypothetical protein
MRIEKFRTSIEIKKVNDKIEAQQTYCVNCYNYKQYPKVQIDVDDLLDFIKSDDKKKSFIFELELEV